MTPQQIRLAYSSIAQSLIAGLLLLVPGLIFIVTDRVNVFFALLCIGGIVCLYKAERRFRLLRKQLREHKQD